VGGSAFELLIHMEGRGEVGIIHCNLFEDEFKCGIPLVMDLKISSGGVVQQFSKELWQSRLWVVVDDHCWSYVIVGVGFHLTLVLFWASTKPPLVSRSILPISIREGNFYFVVSFFNSKGRPFLSVFF
jgi:hypothetical protein